MSRNKLVVPLIAILALISRAAAMGVDLTNIDNIEDDSDRAIIVATGLDVSNVFGINLTNFLPLLAIGAAALLPLLCACALGGLLLAKIVKDKGHDSGGYSGYSTSYSTYSRALGLDDVDWDKLSIIDWISVGEETFRKFDPLNLECHKRVICELHQNVKEFGTFAGRIVDVFGYLRYVELLSLPEMLKYALEEYADAADRGRSLNKDCGDIYSECDFSVKALYDRYSDNAID